MAELVDDAPVGRSTRKIFAGKRAILVGVPAAFSPICSRVHVRGFVEQARSLRLSGFDMIACVSANDPWVMARWARAVDPDGRLRFLSDGNLEFAQACSLTTTGRDLFIGTRLRRFTLVVRDRVIERVEVESSALEVTCSAAGRFLEGADCRPA